METYDITPNHKLINLQPPIPGYERFLGAHLLYGERMALVDVGPRIAIPNLLYSLHEQGISPQQIDYIILTHIHIDHAGGIGTAIRDMGKAKVMAHKRAIAHLIDPTVLWKASLETLGDLAIKYGSIEPVPEDRIVVATDQTKLDLGHGLVLEIYLTPGHAPHHLSIYDRKNGVLIAGEAAGVCVNGRIRPATPPPFKLEEYLSSIDRLIELEPRKLCYGHFGCYDNAVEKLRLIRQKLLTWYQIVNSAAKAGKNPEDILALLRERDVDLDYLNTLSNDEYNREYVLLINSIRGLHEFPPTARGKKGEHA
jgi:glyoxylase-like metal-dependent hydrolase (beta-lactamase superfamily II)